VATGRVANMFDLNGPNVVVDAGGNSLLESLRLAELWLGRGDADLLLTRAMKTPRFVHPARPGTGGPDETAHRHAGTAEGMARAHGWQPLALRPVGAVGDDSLVVTSIDGAGPTTAETRIPVSEVQIAGLGELANAVHGAQRGTTSALRWTAAAIAAAN